MLWQWLAVAAIVAAAAIYLARRAWRTWTRKTCGGCGCASTKKPTDGATVIPPEELRLRS